MGRHDKSVAFNWALNRSSETHASDFADILGVATFSQPAAAKFDGTTDRIQWTTPGNEPFPDTKTFSFAARISRGSITAGQETIWSVGLGGRCMFWFNNSNELEFRLKGVTATPIYAGTSTATYTTTDTLAVVFMSFDIGADAHTFYIDDDSFAITAVRGSDEVASFSANTFNLGADSGGDFYHGCIGPVWVTDEYIDWSVDANRDRDISAPGVLNDPGSNGANWSPTSAQPEIFILDTLNAPAVNAGSAGNPDNNAGEPYDACGL